MHTSSPDLFVAGALGYAWNPGIVAVNFFDNVQLQIDLYGWMAIKFNDDDIQYRIYNCYIPENTFGLTEEQFQK